MIFKKRLFFYFLLLLVVFSLLQININFIKKTYHFVHLKYTIYNLKNENPNFYNRIKNIKNVYIVANKELKIFNVYGNKVKNDEWDLIDSYPFTSSSGELGPKLKEYDGQIPEGIYKPNFLNARSLYHLSIGINYPNSFDNMKAKLSGQKKQGQDIFIHGKDVTIGCIPLGDENIEKLFMLIEHVGLDNVGIVIKPNNLYSFPKIDSVEWENELYINIKKELISNNLF